MTRTARPTSACATAAGMLLLALALACAATVARATLTAQRNNAHADASMGAAGQLLSGAVAESAGAAAGRHLSQTYGTITQNITLPVSAPTDLLPNCQVVLDKVATQYKSIAGYSIIGSGAYDIGQIGPGQLSCTAFTYASGGATGRGYLVVGQVNSGGAAAPAAIAGLIATFIELSVRMLELPCDTIVTATPAPT
eukprot:CAMPEP_0202876816 /NCGR_PEP_ID=MMETSP1391-20130828/29660_1 /ASSEMBLY_ACC=CAM_ASM_000867 /TAXON_ID=1034604 /ORGANISM="Chlamydomonas leiostraca, Strain SAG 11-49" /LENGTH=195 /DNA_ID=CAMNT_0049558741 /DNA_START=38 /DNA_END=622 /DNA_ORIENTATION=-